MKKLICTIAMAFAVLLSALQAYAYEPIYVDGKKWVSTEVYGGMGYNMYARYAEVVGDTVVGDYKVKKIDCWALPHSQMSRALPNGYGFGAKPKHYYTFRMEQGGKVFDVTAEGKASLIMDFESPIGTTWKHTYMGYGEEAERTYKIVNVDTLERGNYKYRRLTIEEATTDLSIPASLYSNDGASLNIHYHVWIEGVGELSSYALIGSDYRLFDTPEVKLDYCIFPTQMRYFESSGVKPVIPPASIDSVGADPDDADSTVYDLSGRIVEKPRKGQIYIVGGKKIVWTD